MNFIRVVVVIIIIACLSLLFTEQWGVNFFGFSPRIDKTDFNKDAQVITEVRSGENTVLNQRSSTEVGHSKIRTSPTEKSDEDKADDPDVAVETNPYEKSYRVRRKIARQFFSISNTKLVDYAGNWGISLTEKEAEKVHSLIKDNQDGFVVYQDRKIFRALSDDAIHADLPICLLKIHSSSLAQSSAYDRNLQGRIVSIQSPIESAANFVAVRLVLANKPDAGISLKYIDCGFLKQGKGDEAFKDLEFADLWATTGFRLIESPAE